MQVVGNEGTVRAEDQGRAVPWSCSCNSLYPLRSFEEFVPTGAVDTESLVEGSVLIVEQPRVCDCLAQRRGTAAGRA